MLALVVGAVVARGVVYDTLPAEREGKFPIHQPKYEGVEQVMLLSGRWLVVATTDLDAVVAKVNEISKGELFRRLDRWDETKKAGKPDWVAFKAAEKLYATHQAAAREAVGERKMDATGFYAVSSADDNAYGKPAAPLRVTRLLVSLDSRRVRGGPDIYYAHYSYLELPRALRDGHNYTVTLANGKKVTFLYDERRTVSRAIKVNQVGYLPDASQKFAYLGACAYELGPVDFSDAKEFRVISVADGHVALTGPVKLREKNPRFAVSPGKTDDPAKRPPLCGEDVYEMDLGPLKEEGEFFISIAGVGRSWTFRHARDAYGEAFYITARGLFHQRCGIALEPAYTDWTRPRCHEKPVCESGFVTFGTGDFRVPKNYERFDVVGATMDTSHTTTNVVGGWHDAADWDRNIYHYMNLFDLLTAYEIAPRKFADSQLHIPESGNGIPDILDEAEFGLRVWKRSLDARGGASGAVETFTHPTIDADFPYAFSVRTRWSSLAFAAAAAQYAQLVKPFNAALSAEYAAAARKAYDFGNNPSNSLGKHIIRAAANRGKGAPYTIAWEETDKMIVPYLLHARLRMFLLSGEKSYLDGLEALAKQMPALFEWPLTDRDQSVWSAFALARGADNLPAPLVESWKKVYLAAADALCAEIAAQPYRHSWPRDKNFHAGWGALCATNPSRVLLAAWALSGDAKYRDAAIVNVDFMLGANALGMSWTSGLGCVYPVRFQHAISEDDGILDPVPGITVYGLTGGPMYHQFRNTIWQAATADGNGTVDFIHAANKQIPFYRSWSAHPMMNTAQCEFTIHETMSSTLFTCALLSADDWRPSDALQHRHPRRDDLVFGYWYLP